jgi:mannose-6-phosphate isomerase-like protein (cupin superfamily)
MNRFLPTVIAVAGILLASTFSPLAPQTPKPQALTLPLACSQGDCPLLRGAPQTAGMRSGFVRLKPGETVGWHTTGNNEESLVILHGRGEALLEGQVARPFTAQQFVYIPPSTRHNVANTSKEVLEYVYVVAPAAINKK